MYKLLIIDDDFEILNCLKDCLSDDYDITTSTDPLVVSELLNCNSFNLVILDINMPKLNGLQLGSQIRSIKGCENLPIVFLTGQDDRSARIACYQVGGDNFILKPFDIDELKAIISRLLQKVKHINQAKFIHGDISMNPVTHQCFVSNQKIELAHKEYQILLYFLQNPDQIISRETLLAKIWKDNVTVSDRTIDSHISNLRKKLQESTCKIKSIYQEGYIFTKQN